MIRKSRLQVVRKAKPDTLFRQLAAALTASKAYPGEYEASRFQINEGIIEYEFEDGDIRDIRKPFDDWEIGSGFDSGETHFCCGIRTIGEFDPGGRSFTFSKDPTVNTLVWQIILKDFAERDNVNLLLATTNHNQKTTRRELLAAGFIEYDTFVSAGTGSTITVLGRNFHTDPGLPIE